MFELHNETLLLSCTASIEYTSHPPLCPQLHLDTPNQHTSVLSFIPPRAPPLSPLHSYPPVSPLNPSIRLLLPPREKKTPLAQSSLPSWLVEKRCGGRHVSPCSWDTHTHRHTQTPGSASSCSKPSLNPNSLLCSQVENPGLFAFNSVHTPLCSPTPTSTLCSLLVLPF